MARSESNIQREIYFHLNRGNSRVFRNNVGTATTQTGEFIRFGLEVGSGDLIGWETIEITPGMVGQKIARFLSVEVKNGKGGRITESQKNWCNTVNRFGGRAIITNNMEDLK